MGKLKKKLKKEKSKVQLKKSEKTKFLPKGQNVTDTSFKIKAIVLPEQLKAKSADVPVSKRHLNVKELITRLKHYNENVRHAACEDMIEIIKDYGSDMIKDHLSLIIQTVSSLIQDKTQKVRRSAVKVIDNLLKKMPVEVIDPFFGFLSVNLRCAMTNICKNTQEDSLLLLDSLLSHVPNLLAKNCEKILSDFITLISKLRNDSQIGRTLTLNLGSKMTSVKWRLKVISRLYSILEAVISDNKKSVQENDVVYTEDVSYIPLYKKSLMNTLENYSFSLFSSNNESISDRSTILKKHITTLIPLLYETWLEVVPENGFKKDNTILNEEASAMLSCIMKIFYLLWKYITLNNTTINARDVFLSKEGKKFLSHLIGHFHYSQGERIKQKNKTKGLLNVLEVNEDPKCVQENLLICYLYSILCITYNERDLSQNMPKIMSYITKCLLSPNYINSCNIEYLVLILKSILIEDSKHWEKYGACIKTVLENTIVFYNNKKVSRNGKLEIFLVLSNINNEEINTGSPSYDVWISSLTNYLLEKEISERSVLILLDIIRKNNTVFQKALLKRFPEILCNLPNLKILETSDEDKVKRNILNIFYYLPLRKENILEIDNFMKNNSALIYVKLFSSLLQLRGITNIM